MPERLQELRKLFEGKSVSLPREGSNLLVVEESHPQMPGIRFFSPDAVINTPELKKNGLQSFYVPEIRRVAVCSDEIEVKARALTHEGSGASYWWQFRNGNDTWYGSAIAPNKETGEDHLHIIGDTQDLDQVEFYEVKFGKLSIRHHENDIWRPMPSKFKVPAGILHRGKAGPDGAFLTIITVNGELYGEENHHVRLSDIGYRLDANPQKDLVA